MINTILYHFIVNKMTDNMNNANRYFCFSVNDPAMSFEQNKLETLAKEINETFLGRKSQNKGKEILFLFSFQKAIFLHSTNGKDFLKELKEEEQCIFFQNLKI